MSFRTSPTEFRSPPIRKTQHRVGCFADVGNDILKFVEFDIDISWVVETSSSVSMILDGKVISTGDGFSDYYGLFKGWDPAVEQAIEVKKDHPSCTVIAKTTLSIKPVVAVDVDPQSRAFSGIEGAFAGHYAPFHWAFMTDEVRRLFAAREAGMNVDTFNLSYLSPIELCGLCLWKDGVDRRQTVKTEIERYIADFVVSPITI